MLPRQCAMLNRDLQMWICFAFRGWSWPEGMELMLREPRKLSRQAVFMSVPDMFIRF